ncbi:EAL domain-containing protein [Pseudomonas resinovorans]|uniref:EAL domain-containing protein n=1 Tax=Metapseudomonas resinovorans TaxID=53412 RepID=A0ABT4YD58_METRE|nr:EAL domain-containing protein [Pseudomonas resinovorans]MDA8486826.1 EAL domain-containing protein [Pseudomonas resinovorans]
MNPSETHVPSRTIGCRNCSNGQKLPFEFSMAFQPIVDVKSRSIFAYESLIRGTDGSGAQGILEQVSEENRYVFDQSCRVKAVELAAKLKIPCYLSINFLPNAVYQAATCIRATLEAARRFDFPTDRIIFEITENEQVVEKQHLKDIILEYKRQGFKTAIDDFGAGYSGLGLLAEFQPDIIKLDMQLIRNIHNDRARTAITKGILSLCKSLDISVIAEGVETPEEYIKLRSLGVELYQGYLFSRPKFEALPDVYWPPRRVS